MLDERQRIWNEAARAERIEPSNIFLGEGGGGDNEENCGKLYQEGLCCDKFSKCASLKLKKNPEFCNYTSLLCYYVVSYFPETLRVSHVLVFISVCYC